MTIKDFIKSMKAEFGDSVEFKAESKSDGKIYRSKNYDKIEEDIRKRKRVDTKALW